MADRLNREENIIKNLFFNCIKKECPEFIVNDINKDILYNLFRWCLRDTEGKLNPKKGLWFYGNIGTGKSTLMKSVLSFINKYWLRDSGDGIYTLWESAPAFCGRYADEGFSCFGDIPTGIDELGTETMPTNYRGNKLNVIAHIICSLSERNIAIPKMVTTNLSFSDVERCYGARVIDRIGMLFNLIEMRGESWRHDSDAIWNMIEAENENV